MDHITDAMEMVEHMSHPAFCVRDGIIVKVNSAAINRLIEPGTAVADLLHTGKEEYAEFSDGFLYLTLKLSGETMGFSVTRKADFDLFSLEQSADNAELQAMALAARELREPLASVMTTADRLFPVTGTNEEPETRELISRINRGLFQMLRVISNMSDANRYATDTAARQEIHNICAIADDVFSKAGALMEHAGIRLEYEGHPEPVYSLADAEKLERTIYNIISNAMKFTPKGGCIRAKLSRRGRKMYLSVQNPGAGIPDHVRGTLFSRFTREPGVEDGRFGIGLGFVLIRSTAALHGGTVLVDQPQEDSTRITMTLAIRPGSGTTVRSPILRVDYAGERDHGLLELAEALPADLYEY